MIVASYEYKHVANTIYRVLLWTPWHKTIKDSLDERIQRTLIKHSDNEGQRFFIDNLYIEPASGINDPADLFNAQLNAPSSRPITLMSFSGVGKTTFLNKMLFNKENAIILDMHDYVNVMSDQAWVDYFQSIANLFPLSHQVIALLLNKIYVHLKVSRDDYETDTPDTENYKIYLNGILFNSRAYQFGESMLFLGFHRAIRMFATDCTLQYYKAKGERDDDNDNNYYVDLINRSLRDTVLENVKFGCLDYAMSVIKKLFKILSILTICSSNDVPTSKPIIAFDNIEHFLNHKVIYDKEIEDLLLTIHTFLRDENARDSDFRHLPLSSNELNYSAHFTVILSIREISNIMQKTANPFNNLDRPDYSQEPIVLKGHVSLEDILNKKLKFVLENRILDPYAKDGMKIGIITKRGKEDEVDIQEAIRFISVIVNDKAFFSFVEQFYSYNKRRALYAIIEIVLGNLGTSTSLNVSKYLMKDTALIRGTRDFEEIARARKEGARSINLRLLFNFVLKEMKKLNENRVSDEDGFLSLLGFDEKDESPVFARRTMIYLSRFKASMSSSNRDARSSLSDLMKAVLVPLCEKNNVDVLKRRANDKPSEIRQLAKAICALRNRFQDSPWAPVVILKYNEWRELSIDDLYNTLLKICEDPSAEYEKDKNGETTEELKYWIGLTIAGRSYLEDVATHWGYFAVQFTQEEKALYDEKFLRARVSSGDDDKLIAHITNVYSKARSWIFKGANKTKDFVKFGENDYRFNELYNNNPNANNKKYLFKQFNFDTEEHVKHRSSKTKTFEEKELTHEERIIVKHISYLHNYRLFLIYIRLSPLFGDSQVMEDIKLHDVIYSNLVTQENYKRHFRIPQVHFKIHETIKISLEIIKIINNYIDILQELTEGDEWISGDDYFIGGMRRIENPGEYADDVYGWKCMSNNLELVKAFPLNCGLSIFPFQSRQIDG